MRISVDQFLAQLLDSELMSHQEVSDYMGTFPAEKMPVDGESLAGELVRDRRLTKYQARTIYRGNRRPLRYGDYVVVEKIGQGGMGKVFKAIHHQSGQPAAIKVLRSDAVASVESVKRFQQEVRVAAQLDHPNIVKMYEAGQVADVHYLVIEFVDGPSLASLLQDRGPLPVRDTLNYIIQTARGLQHAHSKRMIHRDIKPSNLLVGPGEIVKILDMGLARIDEPHSNEPISATLAERLTRRGAVMGTADYMSPEQARDTSSADQRADIYSLGCTLFRLLAGKPVYEAESMMLTIMAHSESDIPSLSDSPFEIPGRLNEVFRRMVAKHPQDRLQSMAEVIEHLEKCLDPNLPMMPRPDESTRRQDGGVSQQPETVVLDPQTSHGALGHGRNLAPAIVESVPEVVQDTVAQHDGNSITVSDRAERSPCVTYGPADDTYVAPGRDAASHPAAETNVRTQAISAGELQSRNLRRLAGIFVSILVGLGALTLGLRWMLW